MNLKDLLMVPVVLVAAALSQLTMLVVILVAGVIVYCVGGATLMVAFETLSDLL